MRGCCHHRTQKPQGPRSGPRSEAGHVDGTTTCSEGDACLGSDALHAQGTSGTLTDVSGQVRAQSGTQVVPACPRTAPSASNSAPWLRGAPPQRNEHIAVLGRYQRKLGSIFRSSRSNSRAPPPSSRSRTECPRPQRTFRSWRTSAIVNLISPVHPSSGQWAVCRLFIVAPSSRSTTRSISVACDIGRQPSSTTSTAPMDPGTGIYEQLASTLHSSPGCPLRAALPRGGSVRRVARPPWVSAGIAMISMVAPHLIGLSRISGSVAIEWDAGVANVAEMHQGTVPEHMDVRGQYTLQGALQNGATVKSGGELVVQGTVSGTIRVESDGTASLQGAVAADIDNQGGVVMVAGVFTGRVLANDGPTAFAVGTLVESRSGKAMQLKSDGSLTAASNQEDVTVGPEYLVLASSGQFVPVDEAP